MLLDEWGGGHNVLQDQNEDAEIPSTFQRVGDPDISSTFRQLEEVEISSTFQNLNEVNPKRKVGGDQETEKLEVSPTSQEHDETNPEHRAFDVQDNDEEVKVSSTLQQLEEVIPKQVKVVKDFLDYPSMDDNDLAKNKAFEKNAEQADNSHNEEISSLEETISATSQEEMRSNRNKRDRLPLGIQDDLAKDNHLSRGKRARKNRVDRQKKKRKVEKFKQVGMKKVRKSDQAKEKAKLREENKDLKRQNKRMKTAIEKFKNRKKPNKRKESKGKRIKSGNVGNCRNADGCNEKWATFSSAAIGPAASIIKQVGELFFFLSPHIFRPILSSQATGLFQRRYRRKATSWRTKTF